MLMLAGGLLVSCGKMETGESTTRLPDGKYPLRLTAEVAQPHPRAGGKEIGVMLDGMLSLQRYVMDASGNTVPKDAENTIYRKSTTETCVTARTPNAEIWNYIVNPSLVAAGGPTPIYTTSYWSSTEAYYSPNNAYAIHFPDATLESNDKYL